MQHGQIARRHLALALVLALVAGVRAAAAENISVAWDPNPEAEVVGYRVFIGSLAGVYDSSVDVGNATSYTLTNVQAGQRYCFSVAAYYAGPTLGTKSADVCTDSNQAPTLQAPGNQSSTIGSAVTLTLSGSDPEGLPVTFSAAGLPAGLTLNTNTGFISGTPTTEATSNVTVTVSDGLLSTSQAFTWTVSASSPNVANPLRPSGVLTTATPTFEWESVAATTSYRLWVDDSSNTDPRIQIDYTPAQAGCTTAGAVCRVSPGVALQPGKGSWSVRATNATGPGPWSGAMDFTVPDSKAPTVTISAPTSASTYTTTATSIALSGTASDDAGIASVTWTNNLGGSGTATGTWTWNVASLPILVGTNIITVTVRDNAGNIGTDVLTVTKSDTEAPSLSILTPNTTPFSTSSATLTMTGSANDQGGVSEVTWTSDRGGSGTASGTTAWSINGIALKGGANVITVTAHDGSGHKTSKTITATQTDGQAPTVSITSPASVNTFATASATLALGGTASDNIGVTQVSWTNSKGGDGVATGTTAWSASVALKPGSNVITVTAKDAAGNVGTDVLTVTATDSVAPAVSITTPASTDKHTTTSASSALGGTASDAFGVTAVRWANDRGGAGVATGTTAWSVAAVGLMPGANVITVTATDAAGNSSTDRITITLDSKAPSVTIASPAANTLTGADTINLSGTASDDQGVTEVTWTNSRGGSGRASGTASWSIANAALQTGVNVFTVVAHDGSGNERSATVSVTRDSKAPSVSVSVPTADKTFVTGKAAFAMSGKASDDNAVTQVTWSNNRGGAGTASGTGDWSIPSLTLANGANVITVTARDSAGNAGTVTLTVTLDTRAPSISITSPTSSGSYKVSDSSVTLGGVASDDSGIAEVTWSTGQGAKGTATGTTSWSAAGVALKAGANAVTMTARDVAGNTSTATITVNATDVKAPTVRITAPSPDPSFTSSVNVINLEGVSTDDFNVARVSWVNDRGGSGFAKNSERWIVGGLVLQPGVNVITVTATDASGNAATDVARITYQAGLPTISLTSPTSADSYATSSSNVAITGVASDSRGISRVKWSTDKGQAGDAVGTTAWSIPAITVAFGTTNVTVTAYDDAGNTASVALSIVYADSTKPAVKVYTPTTSSSFTTGASTVTVAGTASDNVGVTQVSWATDKGGAGTAFGTTSWSTPAITIAAGSTTVVTVTARDAAGNTGVSILTVVSTAKSSTTSTAPTSYTTTTSNLTSGTQSVESAPVTSAPVTSSEAPRPTSTSSSLPGSAPSTGTRTPQTPQTSSNQPSKEEAPAPPVVRILAPTSAPRFTATSETLTVAGVASHASGISFVRWTTDKGDSGLAEGTTKWSIAGMAIKPGTTVITVTAVATNGDTTNVQLTVVRSEPLPKLSIIAPTADSQWTTGTATVALRGTATDNVTRVLWSSDSGATGVAKGTSAWATAAIRLQQGVNRITVTAQDASGRTDRHVLTVTYRPQSGLTAAAGKQASGASAGLE